MTTLDDRRRTPSPLQLREQHREATAPARGIAFAVALWLLAAGLVLAFTADHYTAAHFAGPVLTAVGGALLVRLAHVARSFR